MEHSLHCEFCDKVNIGPEFVYVRIFTQKCSKCNRVSLDRVTKNDKTTIRQTYTCSLCHHVMVTNPTDVCQKCSQLDNHTIMCYYCHMIPKTLSFNNNAVICGICNRAFHATIIKNDRTIASHPHQDKGPADCSICNG